MVRGAFLGGSSFRASRKACRKFREIMQAAEYRYLEVNACRVIEFTKAGDMKD